MSIMRIERHDIYEYNSYLPWPVKPEHEKIWTPERLEGHKPVYRDGKLVGYQGNNISEMKFAEAHGCWWGRLDICLWSEKKEVKCSCCGHKHECFGEQRIVEPGPEGTLIGDVTLLDKDTLTWAFAESAKCWEVALKEPVFKQILERNAKKKTLHYPTK